MTCPSGKKDCKNATIETAAAQTAQNNNVLGQDASAMDDGKEGMTSMSNSNSNSNSKPEVKFWSEDPNILLSQKYIFEFFPTENMGFNQKLNAITRMILVLTVVGYIYTKSTRMVIISAFIVGCIYLLHTYDVRKAAAAAGTEEGYADRNPSRTIAPVRDIRRDFLAPTAENPMGNVLMTDYEDDPQRMPAPPIENPDVANDVLESAKQFVIKSNSGQPDIADKLFSDLGDNFDFEQSMRPFYSTAATEIPNDQNAFAEFCYGGMISCKEGNNFACARNLQRHTLE